MRQWVVALTKIDLVDAARALVVRAEVAAALSAAPYAGALEITGPSDWRVEQDWRGLAGITRGVGSGIGAGGRAGWRSGILLAHSLGIFQKGIGTVVTGTVHGAGCAVGDELIVNPTGLRLRVRGLQIHGDTVERAVEGARVAIKCYGGIGSAVAVEQLHRRRRVVPSCGAVAFAHCRCGGDPHRRSQTCFA